MIAALLAALLGSLVAPPAGANARSRPMSLISRGLLLQASLPSGGPFPELTPALSGDGRFAAFVSEAPELVLGDSNGVSDVFVRDRYLGVTTRESVGPAGREANGASRKPAISADGRYVAFESAASNLVDGEVRGNYDVFVHDRVTLETTRVSIGAGGEEAQGDSHWPSLSADGRFVAFESDASNLVSGDGNATWDVFLHDRASGATTRVSVAGDEVEANGPSYAPAVSASASRVAFYSVATNLVAPDANSHPDVFLRDVPAGTTERVSLANGTGDEGNGPSQYPSISADGTIVAFESLASDLVTGDTNATWDVFVRDLALATTVRSSVATDGTQGDGVSQFATISGDGAVVAFVSAAASLRGGLGGDRFDIFVRDSVNDETFPVSLDPLGRMADDDSYFPAVSGDGHVVAFSSRATNLVDGDSNDVSDVFAGVVAYRCDDPEDGVVSGVTDTQLEPAAGPAEGPVNTLGCTLAGMGL